LLYIVFTVVLSFFVLLGVLYSLGDWVLLSIAIIFVLGIGWASKHTLPRFWNQATLMLNFGSVREGEVVIYKGIPYEVISVNIYSQLENKDLEDGFIRLHINDLVELRSRPMFKNEPWFPSRRGDWVKLNDGTYGEVVGQTPDMVKLKLLGGAHKFYKTSDYLSQSPTNLSAGFRIPVTFGLDYQHQDIIIQEVPGIIERAITEGLSEAGYGNSIEKIRVEFKEAGPSSLDIAVLAEFNGNAGARYRALERAIQRICVDTCNLHHWIIPFQQVTVHMAGAGENNS
jgi:energy-coupling factor transporter transmembrane protein EcfT